MVFDAGPSMDGKIIAFGGILQAFFPLAGIFSSARRENIIENFIAKVINDQTVIC